MHPHLNCPMCNPFTTQYDTLPQAELNHRELTLFLVANAHSRNWQDVATKLLAQFTLTKKEKAHA